MANILLNEDRSEATEKLYLNAGFADVHFLFKNGDDVQKIPANKAILAVISGVFDRMFFGPIKEKGDVEIVDADVDSFKEFLQIFYLNNVMLSMENMEAVCRLADKYDVLGYIISAHTKMINKLTIWDMCWGYQLAVYLKHEDLIKNCENEIIRSPNRMFSSDSFKRCELMTLKRILALDLICYEGDIFNACITWAKQACESSGLDENNSENLKSQLGDCLKLIRFGQINMKDLTSVTAFHSGLFTREEFEDIVHMITVNGFESRIFSSNSRQYKWHDDEKCITMPRNLMVITYGSIDYVSFTSNQPVLLGKIYAPAVQGPLPEYDVKLTVMELDPFCSGNSEKILYGGEWKSYNESLLEIALPQPILIKAHTMYRIQFEFLNHNFLELNQFSEWELGDESYKSEDLEIRFYKNHDLNYDNSNEGWISHLCFQLI